MVLIVVISFLGFCLLTYRELNININFIPIFVCSGLTIIVTMAGIFNILPYVCNVLMMLGCLFFIYEILKLKNKNVFKCKSIHKYLGIALIFIVFVYSIFLVINIKYTEVDDFTHWGLIIKEMFRIKSLPDSSTMTNFKLYPPGTAVWIYYVTKIIGFYESHTLIAQNFLTLSGILSIFAFINKKNMNNSIVGILILFISIFFVNETYIFQSLRVDMVLATVGASSTLMLYYYRRNLKKMFIVMPVMAIECILIKNSGIFFIVVNIILSILFCIKYGHFKINKIKSILFILSIILLPIVAFSIWTWHANIVFENANTSWHAMTIEFSTLMYKEKNLLVIKKIFISSIKEAININTNNPQLILLMFLFTIVLLYRRKKHVLKYLIFLISTYTIYIIGMILMYIFSMTIAESMILVDFHRYQSTIVVYLLCTYVVFFSIKIRNAKDLEKNLMVIITVILLCMSVKNYRFIFSNPEEKLKYRNKVECLINESITFNKNTKIAVYENLLDMRHYKRNLLKFLLLLRPIEIYARDERAYNRYEYVLDISDVNNMKILYNRFNYENKNE